MSTRIFEYDLVLPRIIRPKQAMISCLLKIVAIFGYDSMPANPILSKWVAESRDIDRVDRILGIHPN